MNKHEIQVIDINNFGTIQLLINNARYSFCINNNLYILQENQQLYSYNLSTNYTTFLCENIISICPIKHIYVLAVGKESILLFNKDNILECKYIFNGYQLSTTDIITNKNYFYLSERKQALYQIISNKNKLQIIEQTFTLINSDYKVFNFNIEFNYIVLVSNQQYFIRKLSDQSEQKYYNALQQKIQSNRIYVHQDTLIIITEQSIQIHQIPFQSKNNIVVNYFPNSICIEQKQDLWDYIQLKNRQQIIMLPKLLQDTHYFHYISINKGYIYLAQFGPYFLMSNENNVVLQKNIGQTFQIYSNEKRSYAKLLINQEKNKETFFKYCKAVNKQVVTSDNVKYGPFICVNNNIVQIVLKPLNGKCGDEEFVITESMLQKIEELLREIEIQRDIKIIDDDKNDENNNQSNDQKMSSPSKQLYDYKLFSYLQQFCITKDINFDAIFIECYNKIQYEAKQNLESNDHNLKQFIRLISEMLLYLSVDTYKVAYQVRLVKFNLNFDRIAEIDLSAALLQKLFANSILKQLQQYKDQIKNNYTLHNPDQQQLYYHDFTSVLSQINIKMCNNESNIYIIIQCNNSSTLILNISLENFEIVLEKEILMPEKIMKISFWQGFIIMSTLNQTFYILNQTFKSQQFDGVLQYKLFKDVILLNQKEQVSVLNVDSKCIFTKKKQEDSDQLELKQVELNDKVEKISFQYNFYESVIQCGIIYYFEAKERQTLEFLYQEYNIEQIIYEISNYMQFLHNSRKSFHLTLTIKRITETSDKIDQYLLCKALIHWMKRQEADQIEQIMEEYESSPQQVFKLCQEKHFPDLCIMLINFLGWNNQDNYFLMLDFAFNTYSLELADLIIQKITDEKLNILQYKYQLQHVWPIIYLYIKQLHDCISPDIRLETDSVKIAHQLVNMINFKNISNQQFTNFIYNGYITEPNENTIVCTGKLAQLQFDDVQQAMQLLKSAFPQVVDALLMLGFKLPVVQK